MRWIIYIVAVLAGLGGLIAIVGALLPKKHSVARTAKVAIAPDALYTLLSDVSQYPAWRADLKSLQRLPDKDGRPAWIEESNGMEIPMTFERMERPSLL